MRFADPTEFAKDAKEREEGGRKRRGRRRRRTGRKRRSDGGRGEKEEDDEEVEGVGRNHICVGKSTTRVCEPTDDEKQSSIRGQQ